MMDQIQWMKVFVYFLFAVCCVVECRNLFVPTGPAGSSQASPEVGGIRSHQNQVWKIGELGRKSKKELLKYLTDYGYTGTYSQEARKLSEGIKDFQHFVSLPITGQLDPATIKMINTDRCGMKDPRPQEKRREAELKIKLGRSGRWKRYNHQGSTWRHLTLTWQYVYNPSQRNNRLSEDQVRNVMKVAMKKWTDVTNIQFKEVRTPFTVGDKNEPDIIVRFVSGVHTDPFPFDGKGGTLAHAFYPGNNIGFTGDVHFDDDEDFTLNGARPGYEIDLMWVATHELGHTLGLDHSRDQNAVMYPYYLGYVENIKLGSDDRMGIQTLYGGKIRPKVSCPTTHLAAVWNSQKGTTSTYLMLSKDQKLYRVSKNGKGVMGESFPKSKYYKMPYAIDAAYQTNFGREGDPLFDVIFTSDGYYIYQGFSRISGPYNYKRGSVKNFCRSRYPDDRTPLKINFPPNVRKIDAVMKWQRNRKVYFFTGQSYYRYDEKKKMFDCGYPRRIESAWRGLPANIDAAYSSKEKTFFIKEDKIYHFDDALVRVKEDNPKNIREDILQCEEDK